MATRYVVVN